jgi:hypothetical protein
MNLLFPILLILIGIGLPSAVNVSAKDKNILRILWLYHLIFCVYYYFFLRVDSYTYYRNALSMTTQDFWDAIVTSGTDFINALCCLLVNAGFSSYFSLILLFSLIGYIGIILFYKIIITTIPTNSRYGKIQLFPFLLFLPDLHLWSVAVGKDSLLFFLIALFTYSLLRLNKRFLGLIFCVFVAYHIRPHVALIMILSLGAAFFFRKDTAVPLRIFMVILFVGITAAIIPMVLEHFAIEENSVENITEFVDSSSQNLSYGGSAVDISGYPYPLKLLTFLYRPFFFDINGLPALILSFESLLSLLLMFRVLKSQPLKAFKAAPFAVQFACFFFIFGSLVFCAVISNMGNIIRQRNMFLPCMLIYFLWVFSHYQSKFHHKSHAKGCP